MKAFLASIIVMIAIAYGAYLTLNELGWSSAEMFSSDSVRLD